MDWPFLKGTDQEDFSACLKDTATSKKKELIAECQRRGVSIFVDDQSESSTGIYAQLRAVASEAELERRLLSVKALGSAQRANVIAWLAMAVAVVGLLAEVLRR